jgi:hypothetical protein
MPLFLFGVFPLVLILTARFGGGRRIQAVILGLTAGILVCVIRWLFFFSPGEVRADFLQVFFPLFLRASLAPALLAYLLLRVIFTGTVREKSAAAFFLLASYFAVMVPYRVMTNPSPPGYYELHLVPLMYAALSLTAALLCAKIFGKKALPEDSRALAKAGFALGRVFAALCLLAALALPPAAEAERYSGGPSFPVITAAFFALALAVFIWTRLDRG